MDERLIKTIESCTDRICKKLENINLQTDDLRTDINIIKNRIWIIMAVYILDKFFF